MQYTLFLACIISITSIRLLLQMSHVLWSVCLSASVLLTTASFEKTEEPIEMPFGCGED